MRTFFSRYKLLFWLLLLLLILNVSVLTTILIRNLNQRRILPHPPAVMQFHRPGPAVYLKDELDLSEEQSGKFIPIRREYQRKALELNGKITSLRGKYWQEIMKTGHDEDFTHVLADSIGLLHVQLLHETADYYYQIRAFCREDQVQKLNTFFFRTVENDGRGGMPGGGLRHGMRGRGSNARDVKN